MIMSTLHQTLPQHKFHILLTDINNNNWTACGIKSLSQINKLKAVAALYLLNDNNNSVVKAKSQPTITTHMNTPLSLTSVPPSSTSNAPGDNNKFDSNEDTHNSTLNQIETMRHHPNPNNNTTTRSCSNKPSELWIIITF